MSGISLTQNVYDRLRADLLACRLVPGQKLKINDLCERLAVGTSAVREALSRLASEGFITAEPQRGFRVAPLSLDELRDLTDTRCQIEGLCLRSAIDAWRAGMGNPCDRLPAPALEDSGVGARRSRSATMTPLRTRTRPFMRRWWPPARAPGCCASERRSTCSRRATGGCRDRSRRSREISTPEHAEIAAATLARDADRAVELLSKHFQLTAQIILESADEGLIAMNAPAPKARLREGAAGTLSTSS